jgi:proline dehydrogenase
MRIVEHARQLVSACLRPLALRAARAYVAGDHLEDAVRVADRLAGRGLAATFGFWDAPGDSPRSVADQYVAAARVLAGREHAYLSIKVPSLAFSHELMAEVVDQAARANVRVHLDALAPDTVDRSRALVEKFLDAGADLSFTLPGRWRRSVADAAWAIERGIIVRVVKGQWPDPDAPGTDLRQGFLQVIDALAGRANHVAVASHDVPLVKQAVARLRTAATTTGLELLYGLPMRQSLHLADRLALGVHVYVPYGKAYLPYAMSRLGSDPRIAWWLVRDLMLGATIRPERPEREFVGT